NCLFLTRHGMNFTILPGGPKASVRLENNTIVSSGWAANLQISPPTVPVPAPGPTALPLEARRNACSSGLLHLVYFSPSREADEVLQREYRSLSPQYLALEDQGNLLGAGSELVGFAVINQAGDYRALKAITTLDEWRDFWKLGKADAVVGRIPF